MRNRPTKFLLYFWFLLSAGSIAYGQTPPNLPSTSIFLVNVAGKGTKMRLGDPVRLTPLVGYNNQPSFAPDGRSFLYTFIGEDRQADTLRYDFETRSSVRVTRTTESEYSPTVMPGGKFFSVVRVEADGTQRLWKFPLAGGEPSLVLEKIKPVGYHAWLNEYTLALFVLGEPNTLQIADVRTGSAQTVERNIGRALHRIPRRSGFSFVHKVSEQEWFVKAFDLKTRVVSTLVKTLPGSEDLAWMPGGSMLMAKDAKLYKWDSSKGDTWQEVADFSGWGLRNITRLAVSAKGDKIALVAQRGDAGTTGRF